MEPTLLGVKRIFTNIEANTGVAMRADWKCCQSCGRAALEGFHTRFAFFHQQDTMSAVGSNRLYIAYSCPDGDEDASVGETVAEALRAAGCKVEWNGSAYSRIIVEVDGTTFHTHGSVDNSYEDDIDTEEE